MPKDWLLQSPVINSCDMGVSFVVWHCHGVLSLDEEW